MKHIKSILLFVLGFALPLAMFAQNGHRIEVKAKGFQGNQAFLAYHYGDKQYLNDTVQVSEAGSIVFEGEEKMPGGIYLIVFPPDNNYFEIMLNEEDQTFTLETEYGNFVPAMKVSGSTENKVFYEDLNFLSAQRKKVEGLKKQQESLEADSEEYQAIQAKVDQVDEDVKKHRSDIMEKYPTSMYTSVLKAMEQVAIPDNPDPSDSTFAYRYYKKHFFDQINLSDSRMLRTPIHHQKVMEYMTKLVLQHPDSVLKEIYYVIDMTRKGEKPREENEAFKYFTIVLLNHYANSKIMCMDKVYVNMVEKYYLSGDAYWSDEEQLEKMRERVIAMRPTLCQSIAPNISVPDLNGRPVSLHGVDTDYTILYFWDYDCSHCKKVTPALAELYNTKYKDKFSVKLYAVSINGDKDQLKERIEEYKLDGLLLEDHSRRTGFDRLYDVRSTPRVFLLDKNKKIIAKQIDVEQLDKILQRKLGIVEDDGQPQIMEQNLDTEDE